MSYTSYGIIYLSNKSELATQNRIATYMVSEAVKRNFGIFLGSAIPQGIGEKLILQLGSILDDTKTLMPFSFSDSFLYYTCEKIFEPISIYHMNDPQKRQADISETIFPKLQDFFSEVLKLEEIEKIHFFWDGDNIDEDYRRILCAPHLLCDAIQKELEITGSFEPSLFIELKG